MDLALWLCRHGLDDVDVHGVIAVQPEHAELFPNPRWADQHEHFAADGLVGAHRSPLNVGALDVTVDTKDLGEIVDRQLAYPRVHQLQLEVGANHVGSLISREDNLEQIRAHALGGQVDEGQIPEAIHLQIVLELIFTVIAETDGCNPVAGQDGRFNGLLAVSQIGHGRGDMLVKHFNLVAVERLDDAEFEPMTPEDFGLVLRNEEIQRIVVHVEFQLALRNGAYLRLKLLQAVRCCDQDVCHVFAPKSSCPSIG